MNDFKMNTITFEDFDAYADAIKNANVKFTLTQKQQLFWQLQQFELDGLQVQFGLEGSGTITEGSSQDGGLVLFSMVPTIGGRANGEIIDSESAFLIEPGREFCISATSGCTWFSVFVPNEILGSLGYQSGQKDSRVVAANATQIAKLRGLLTTFNHAMASCPGIIDSPAAITAANDIKAVMTRILSAGKEPSPNDRPRVSRNEIIRRSLSVIDQNVDHSIRVEDLVTATGVSERTLRTAFVEWFGAPPSRYLQLRQLHEVRKFLLNSHRDDTTVSKVLTRQGIWEFGRFAARYRKMFGELPSVALQASRA